MLLELLCLKLSEIPQSEVGSNIHVYLCVSGNASDAEETGGSGFVQLAHLGVAGDVEGAHLFYTISRPFLSVPPYPLGRGWWC